VSGTTLMTIRRSRTPAMCSESDACWRVRGERS